MSPFLFNIIFKRRQLEQLAQKEPSEVQAEESAEDFVVPDAEGLVTFKIYKFTVFEIEFRKETAQKGFCAQVGQEIRRQVEMEKKVEIGCDRFFSTPLYEL